LTLSTWNTRAAIHDTQRAGRIHRNFDRGPSRGMRQRVLDEVAYRPAERVGTAANSYRFIGTGDRNGFVLRQCQRGDIGRDFGRDRRKVGYLSLADNKSLQLGNIEKLVHQSTHA